ncbi:MAG: HEPN domain-containing protein, partial [Duncaniella sp.]|nr:HEPN domain-containing protein [Duncaniella sp.]
MTLTNDQREIAVGLLIEKSHRNMEQAVKNAGLDYWDLVANRLYYSLFHAVTALMLADGIKTSTHKGTSSQFGRYYVLTGKFSREDGMLYSRLQTMREKADYQNTFNLTPEQGSELIAKADDLQ